MKWVVVALLSMMAHSEGILFVDLNDADGEVNACSNADPANFYLLNRKAQKGPVNKLLFERTIAGFQKAKKCPDTIVMSGHCDGAACFGAAKGNSLNAAEIEEVFSRYPDVKACVKNFAIWGCYGGTLDSNKDFWLKSTMGKFNIAYPLQAREKNNKASQETLAHFCSPDVRQIAANAGESGNPDDLCLMYQYFPKLAGVNYSMATCSALAYRNYAGDNRSCYSWQELENKCADFDASPWVKQQYENYLKPKSNDSRYFDPPPDKSTADNEEFNCDKKFTIRCYYNRVHMWWHCREKKDENGNVIAPGLKMDMPSQIIRLAKFKYVVENINSLNRAELNEYDQLLSGMGLGDYRLGDLRTLTRKQMYDRLLGAQQALKSGNYNQSGYDASAVLSMSRGISETLIDLLSFRKDRVLTNEGWKKTYPICVDFTAIDHNANQKSECIGSYDQNRVWEDERRRGVRI